jgi:hypothetical protein
MDYSGGHMGDKGGMEGYRANNGLLEGSYGDKGG